MRGVEIQSDIKLGQKLLYINWGLVALVTILACPDSFTAEPAGGTLGCRPAPAWTVTRLTLPSL